MDNRPLAPEDSAVFEYTLADYWSALYHRKWIILLVMVVAAVCAGVVSSRLPRRYQASVVFYVPRDVETSVGIGTNLMRARMPSGVQDHARAYAALLQHPDAWVAVQARYPKKALWTFGRDVDIVATREGIIRIFSRDEDPELAADIANGMVDYFNSFHRGIIERDIGHSLEKIDEEIDRIGQQILDAIKARQAFQETKGIASMPRNLDQLETERVEFTRRLLTAQVQEASIREQLASLDRQMEVESSRYVRGQLLETNEGAFHAQLRQRKTLLEVELSGLEAELAGVRKAIQTIDSTIRALPEVVTELRQFDDDIQGYLQVRERFEKTRDDLRTRSLELRQAALVIKEAKPPRFPTFPKTTLNVVVAAVAGLIVGIIYALLLEAHRLRRRRESLRNLEIERRKVSRAETPRDTAGLPT